SPSERQKPSASSSSCPGVRIVTATGRPPMRISSGSSTATWSRSLRPPGKRTTSTAAAEYGGAPSMSVTLRFGLARQRDVRRGGGAVRHEVVEDRPVALDRRADVARRELVGAALVRL